MYLFFVLAFLPKLGCFARGWAIAGLVSTLVLGLTWLRPGGLVGSAITWSASEAPEVAFRHRFRGDASALGRIVEVLAMFS
jgi:hypothetical protein